jgi:hypothetical protein
MTVAHHHYFSFIYLLYCLSRFKHSGALDLCLAEIYVGRLARSIGRFMGC